MGVGPSGAWPNPNDARKNWNVWREEEDIGAPLQTPAAWDRRSHPPRGGAMGQNKSSVQNVINQLGELSLFMAEWAADVRGVLLIKNVLLAYLYSLIRVPKGAAAAVLLLFVTDRADQPPGVPSIMANC
ncbi:hypothetical protein GPALN_010879 [Globodera pallida]|nr:hypothetical protein GPALN_010879 [Globodera pallida]